MAEDPVTPMAVGLAMHGGEFTGIDLNPISLFIDRPATVSRGPLGPSGGAAVFPTDLFRRFGGFDEHLFAWGEDADLAFRLYASGVRTRPLELVLPHAGGHSVEGDNKLQGFRAFLLARNRLLVAARTFTWPLMLVAIPMVALAHLALAARRRVRACCDRSSRAWDVACGRGQPRVGDGKVSGSALHPCSAI